MTRWAMVADLERCVGCQTCTAACRHANATSPAVQWRKVLDIEAGAYPNVSRTFVPVGCQHCADPPCMHVCPTTATRQRPDGIVTIDYDICIGCAYCDVACPYQARFKVDAPRYAYGRRAIKNEAEREDSRRIGVAQKCTFCSDRVDFGLANGLTPGIDPAATPACVNACIADALYFGDLDDPNSSVSRLLREQRSFRMHEEIGTDPRFHYVYGEAASSGQSSDPTNLLVSESGHVRARGVEPWHQQHWDWKAAGNFIFGGAGTSLFVTAGLVSLWSGPLYPVGLIALGLVAFGLALLLLKIGRPLRFIYVLRQPQRSWMAREAWVAGAFFPLGVLAMWIGTPTVTLAAIGCGLLFLFSQAMILREAKGIPAWRTSAVVPLIVATGLAEGASLFLVATIVLPGLIWVADTVAAVVVLLAAVRSWAWRGYQAALAAEGAPSRAVEVLDAFRPAFFLVGLAVPTALIIAGYFAASAAVYLFALGGLCVLLSGAALKFMLVVRVGFNQGFALVHTPARGSGVAGPPIRPGWTVS